MPLHELDAMVDGITDALKDHIDKQFAGFMARLDALEKREPRDGRDGLSIQGQKGDTGDRGRDGIDGKDGIRGESAYEIAVRRGFVGDESMWLESLGAKASQTVDAVSIEALVSKAVTAAIAEFPLPKDGLDGADGKDGQDADDSRVKAIELKLIDFDTRLIETASAQAGELERAIAALPAPKDGASVTVENVAPLIVSEVEKCIALLPKPQDGRAGSDGANGVDGKDGLSVTVEDVAPLIAGEVTKQIAAIPTAKDGVDGVGLVGAVIDRDRHLILTLSNGATKDVGIVVGEVDPSDVERTVKSVLDTWPKPKDGVDGAPGRDGTLDGLKFVQVDARTVEARLKATGELVEGGVFQFPTPVMRGVFDANASYEPADMVSRGGSMWICRVAGKGIAPDEYTSQGKEMWTLCIKRGRDGKQGEKGMQGDRGPKGEQGERGPERW